MSNIYKLINYTIAGTIAMCLGFLLMFLQLWVPMVIAFGLFVFLFSRMEKLRKELTTLDDKRLMT